MHCLKNTLIEKKTLSLLDFIKTYFNHFTPIPKIVNNLGLIFPMFLCNKEASKNVTILCVNNIEFHDFIHAVTFCKRD